MKKRFLLPIISICSCVLFFQRAFPSGLRCDFSQDNRTYIWNLLLDCDRGLTPKLSWGVSSSINSTLIKRSIFSDNKDRWQEDGRIDLNLDYLLTQRLRIGALFSQNLNSLEERKVTSSEYGVKSELNLAGISFIQVLGAKSLDRTSGETKRSESGFNYAQTISFSPRIVSGAETEISLSQTTTQLKNIPLIKRDFNLSFFKYLSNSASADLNKDSLQVNYQEAWAKKKFFAGEIATPQINTQKKNQRSLGLCASKRVPLGITFDLTFDLLSNRYRYSADSDTLLDPLLTDNWASSQDLYLAVKREFFRRLSVESFYKYITSKEDYSGDEKDQRLEGGEWGGRLTAEMTRADSVYLTASVGVTSFFAPLFSGQFNDRDVLTTLLWGDYLHVFNPHFDFRMEGGFRSFHQLYMSDRLSSNNNHNQTYLLSPTVTWQPSGRVNLKQGYSIQANYIYYDYEKARESEKNKLFRRASSTSQIIYRHSRRLAFSFDYTYRYEDYGQLIWKDQWAQKASWDRRTNTFGFSMDYQPIRKVSFFPEYTYEKRKSWDHVGEEVQASEGKTAKAKRIPRNRFSRNIVSLSIKYSVDKDNYVYFSAAHRSQKGTQTPREGADYVTVSVARIF